MPVHIDADRGISSEVEELRTECQTLREKLAIAEKYRDYYRAEFVKTLKQEYGDVDELEKQSAGPISFR